MWYSMLWHTTKISLNLNWTVQSIHGKNSSSKIWSSMFW
jgi:hypothetical protein